MIKKIFPLADEQATVAFGKKLADLCQKSLTIHLLGDLGAGKTTFSRGFIQAKGHSGNVKSPTYTLVEPYELKTVNIYHFDLYRLADPEELEFMGIRDYLDGTSICLVEWPEKGEGVLANPDITITMQYQGEARSIELVANSTDGEHIISTLS